jgi:putative SOS response-associated peptidase YedK
MCGRFTLTASTEALSQLFPLFANIELAPRYNIAPTQNVLAVRVNPDSEELEAVRLRWGLIPSWAKDTKIGATLINARAETFAEKPSFRTAFKHRHCVILADGFYEWKKLDAKTKQHYHIHLKDRRPFAFAGLWERWSKGEEPTESCTILTTEANQLLRPLHERMPVILEPRSHEHWLRSPGVSDPAAFPYLAPLPDDKLEMTAVNPVVNNARNDVPECLQPV